jgi:hypothetical protein
MKISVIWPALALAALAVPCAAQQRVVACTDSITGNPAMTAASLVAAERQGWPEPGARAEYRLTMLQERLSAWQHEEHRIPLQLTEFAPPVAEVPWLSTCDPWSHRVAFTPRGDEYELRSAGPDGTFGTDDDVVRRGMFIRAVRSASAPPPAAPASRP